MILYLNAEVGGLSMLLKINIKKKKIKTTKAKQQQQKKKQKYKITDKVGFEPRPLAWKARFITTGLLYHMAR